MLPKLFSQIDKECEIRINKFLKTEDVSALGAFARGDVIDIEIAVASRLGACGVVCRIKMDGGADRDIPLELVRSDEIFDIYSFSLDTAELCGERNGGLFYYEFLFLRGLNTLFTSTNNNKDFLVEEKEGRRFRLLVHSSDYRTPESFGRGVMYQIFTDRFFKGEGERVRNLPVRDDAQLNPDWDHGIPQYAAYSGAPLKNNMFFGGNLWGVAEKLDYLVSLGVTYIYLCPIFEAYSNHKYDTADYTHVDEMFGGDEALDNLISEAKSRGIGIILDGVFNHTGDDSVYFNKYRKYGDGGAYNDAHSEYADWYKFRIHPYDYESWWGIDILPKLNHKNEGCRRYFTGENGIIAKYIRRGIAGWRLDVADELSNEFLDELRESAKKSSDGEAVIIGEVWENAADKVAYAQRRRYFLGKQLDSVMNYPLKNAIVSFCLYGDGEFLYDTLTEIYASYPTMVSHKLMNLLGTHDTERILTVLGRDEGDENDDNCVLATKHLTAEQKKEGVKLLKIAAALQFTAYGIPSVYYGDEVGLEGYGDPFCRMPFPWNDMNDPCRTEILDYYRALGRMRANEAAFDGGRFYFLDHSGSHVTYVRENKDSRVIISANRGEEYSLDIPQGVIYVNLMSGVEHCGEVKIHKDSVAILKEVRMTGAEHL